VYKRHKKYATGTPNNAIAKKETTVERRVGQK
jgi:hypothetical protein